MRAIGKIWGVEAIVRLSGNRPAGVSGHKSHSSLSKLPFLAKTDPYPNPITLCSPTESAKLKIVKGFLVTEIRTETDLSESGAIVSSSRWIRCSNFWTHMRRFITWSICGDTWYLPKIIDTSDCVPLRLGKYHGEIEGARQEYMRVQGVNFSIPAYQLGINYLIYAMTH